MEPKEKAQALVDKFRPIVYPYMGSGMLTNTDDEGVILMNAKTCALWTAEAVFNETSMYTGNLNPRWEYWKRVIEEIKNL